MSATIAVIVPCFNAIDTLPRLVEALKAQFHADFQAFFVDDGSTDDGRAFLEGVARQDARFVVLAGTHAGPGMARNIGLDEIDKRGVEFFTFVDADDVPMPDMLSSALETMLSTGADIVHYQWNSVPGGAPHKDSLRGVPAIYVWNKLYRREAVLDVRFASTMFAEDLAFYLETELRRPKRVAILRPLYTHVKNPKSLWETRNARDVAESVKTVVAHLQKLASGLNVPSRWLKRWNSFYLPNLLVTWKKSVRKLSRESRRKAGLAYIEFVDGIRFPLLCAFCFRTRHFFFRFRMVYLPSLREKLRTIKWYLRVIWARRNYRLLIRRVQERISRGEKLKVVFVVSECSKWKTQSLYDLMRQSDAFDPLVAITAYGDWRHVPAREEEVVRSKRFFSSRGIRHTIVSDFKTGCQTSLRELNPDFVFYDQPWELEKSYMPLAVSRYALTAYVPYFVPTHAERPAHYALDFFKGLFLYIQLNDAWCERFRRLMEPRLFAGRLVGLGHTAFDDYYLRRGGNGDRRYVIYAPHWAFPHHNNANGLDISTFLWNGKEILAYAQKHPEFDWVFKPHPRLRAALVASGAWTRAEVDRYYADWEKIATCRFDGDYVRLFLESRAMITDCSSFLVEYPPSGGAMIHLRSQEEKVPLHELNSELYETFYQVHDLGEMNSIFAEVLERGKDFNRERRMKAVRDLGIGGVYAASNIIQYLMNLK